MPDDFTALAVIGGTGLNQLGGFEIDHARVLDTPYGSPSAPLQFGRLDGQPVVFLARHGEGHKIPPHAINYRANIWALRELGVRNVIAVAAVGGIRQDMEPGRIALPDQIIDYTWGRAHTFYDGQSDELGHVEFGQPYSASLRRICLQVAESRGLHLIADGVYAATQGPRLETEAEIRRLRNDGADMVGMTGMPEAALAREAGLEYACCAVVVNWAAGLADGGIHDQIEQSLAEGMDRVHSLLTGLVAQLGHDLKKASVAKS